MHLRFHENIVASKTCENGVIEIKITPPLSHLPR